MSEKIVIVSVGGSLIVPDLIDVAFLKQFRTLISKYTKKGMKFVIICGGGKTARNYQKAAKSLVRLEKKDIDWLGIQGTIINAHLMRTIFYADANPLIIQNPTKKTKFKKNIIVASGWKPGFSTDFDSVMIAKNFGTRRIVNLSNIDNVYDKDPKKFKDAKPIKKIGWKRFRKMLPDKWTPGMNVPFDPVASKAAQRSRIEVAIINGNKLKNFERYLQGKSFIGTLIG